MCNVCTSLRVTLLRACVDTFQSHKIAGCIHLPYVIFESEQNRIMIWTQMSFDFYFIVLFCFAKDNSGHKSINKTSIECHRNQIYSNRTRISLWWDWMYSLLVVPRYMLLSFIASEKIYISIEKLTFIRNASKCIEKNNKWKWLLAHVNPI